MSETASSTAKRGPAAPAAPEPLVRSPEEIQADIDSAQQRLAETVDQLSERLSPASLADDAKDGVKSVFVDEYGTVKPKPIAIIGGTVAALLVLRAIFHKD